MLLTALAHDSRWFGPAVVATGIYLTFWIAYGLPTLRWPGDRDHSYGLFLYGFPVQQALVALMPDIQPLPLFALASVGALGLALLSWHLIERPALRWKRRTSASSHTAVVEPAV